MVRKWVVRKDVGMKNPVTSPGTDISSTNKPNHSYKIEKQAKLEVPLSVSQRKV